MGLYQAVPGTADPIAFSGSMLAIDNALQVGLGTGVLSGLTVDGTGTLQTGTALIGHVVTLAATVNLLPLCAASTTNYIYLAIASTSPNAAGTDTGQVLVNQTGTPPLQSVLLATVVTGAGSSFTSASNAPAGRNTLLLPLYVPLYNTFGNSGATPAVDWSQGSVQKVTLNANATFSFANPQAGKSYELVLLQDATGSRTVTWPASVKWPSGTVPVLTTTAGKVDIFRFRFDGTSYYGATAGLNY